MKKILLAILIILQLSFSTFAEGIILSGVNDSYFPYNYATTPIHFGGTIYAPYTLFNESLGIKAINQEDTIVMYDFDSIITIDKELSTVYDQNLKLYTNVTLKRGGVYYIKADFMAEIFDLNFTYTELEDYDVFRVYNDSASMSETVFSSFAIAKYEETFKVPEEEDDIPTPPVTGENEDEEDEKTNITTINPYFVSEISSSNAGIFNNNATFFVDSSTSLDSIVNAYQNKLAIGISVGEFDTLEETISYIDSINQYLFDILGIKTTMILTENAFEYRANLINLGYSIKSADMDGFNLQIAQYTSLREVQVTIYPENSLNSMLNFINANDIKIEKDTIF